MVSGLAGTGEQMLCFSHDSFPLSWPAFWVKEVLGSLQFGPPMLPGVPSESWNSPSLAGSPIPSAAAVVFLGPRPLCECGNSGHEILYTLMFKVSHACLWAPVLKLPIHSKRKKVPASRAGSFMAAGCLGDLRALICLPISNSLLLPERKIVGDRSSSFLSSSVLGRFLAWRPVLQPGERMQWFSMSLSYYWTAHLAEVVAEGGWACVGHVGLCGSVWAYVGLCGPVWVCMGHVGLCGPGWVVWACVGLWQLPSQTCDLSGLSSCLASLLRMAIASCLSFGAGSLESKIEIIPSGLPALWRNTLWRERKWKAYWQEERFLSKTRNPLRRIPLDWRMKDRLFNFPGVMTMNKSLEVDKNSSDS